MTTRDSPKNVVVPMFSFTPLARDPTHYDMSITRHLGTFAMSFNGKFLAPLRVHVVATKEPVSILADEKVNQWRLQLEYTMGSLNVPSGKWKAWMFFEAFKGTGTSVECGATTFRRIPIQVTRCRQSGYYQCEYCVTTMVAGQACGRGIFSLGGSSNPVGVSFTSTISK